MNATGASILTILVLVVLLGSRRWALLAMMAGVLFVPQAQQIEVANFNLFSVRFLELAGFIRVVSRGEFSFLRLNKIDRALLLLYSFTATVYLLRSTEGVAYMIGVVVDAWLCYFTFRALMVDMEDVRWFLKAFVFLLAPFVLLLLIESLTRYNVFSAIENGLTGSVRGERFRCVGSFRHPDLLGTLGASFLPLYIGLARGRTGRVQAFVAIGLCLAIVWCSNSGGPVCAAAMGVIGWGCWKFRAKMREVRWGIVGLIVLAALLMKAPVWYLLAHVSDVVGGGGWHRSYLMDVSFQHLGQWWFDGMRAEDTSDWFPYNLSLTGTVDITNEYLAFGLGAGLGAMALLILLLVRGFGATGEAMASVRLREGGSNETAFLLWGLGVMLAVHVINWFGISYFDQIYVVWFLQLAAVSSVTEHRLETSPSLGMHEAVVWSETQEAFES
jgi:hypothetical protein